MNIKRFFDMPNGNTFEIPVIKKFIEKDVFEIRNRGGVIVDPFANRCKYGTITNDLNPEFNTDYNMDALEFLKSMENNFADLILFDPPYSFRQASELYKNYGKEKLEVNVSNMKYWSSCKDNIKRILKLGGIVLCFGWNSNGVGKNRGFEMTDLLLVHHGGSRNDTICTREIKRFEDDKLFDW